MECHSEDTHLPLPPPKIRKACPYKCIGDTRVLTLRTVHNTHNLVPIFCCQMHNNLQGFLKLPPFSGQDCVTCKDIHRFSILSEKTTTTKNPVILRYHGTESLVHMKTFHNAAAFTAKKFLRQPRGQSKDPNSAGSSSPREGTAGPLQNEAFPSNRSSPQT